MGATKLTTELINKNVFIAEFMGAKKVESDKGYFNYYEFSDGEFKNQIREDKLNYHEDWNKLIPVVKKFELWYIMNNNVSKCIYHEWVILSLVTLNIKNVFEDLMGCIEFYNTFKNK